MFRIILETHYTLPPFVAVQLPFLRVISSFIISFRQCWLLLVFFLHSLSAVMLITLVFRAFFCVVVAVSSIQEFMFYNAMVVYLLVFFFSFSFNSMDGMSYFEWWLSGSQYHRMVTFSLFIQMKPTDLQVHRKCDMLEQLNSIFFYKLLKNQWSKQKQFFFVECMNANRRWPLLSILSSLSKRSDWKMKGKIMVLQKPPIEMIIM